MSPAACEQGLSFAVIQLLFAFLAHFSQIKKMKSKCLSDLKFG